MKKKYFIYNSNTGRCLSRLNYYDTPRGRKTMAKDHRDILLIMPSAKIGEVFFDKSGIEYTVPKDIENVRPK